jgi:hypothetical protein
VVNFTPRPLYPRYPLDRSLGGPQSRSGRRGEVKMNSDPSVVQPVATEGGGIGVHVKQEKVS